MRLKDGVAEVRAGATLLYDSDPDEEERETPQGVGLPRRPAPPGADVHRRVRGDAAARPGQANAPRGSSGLLRPHAGQLPAPDGRRGDDLARGISRGGGRRARARPGRAVAGARHAEGLRRVGHAAHALERGCPSSACAWGCRAWSSISAARSACSTTRCTASPRASAWSGAACSRDCRRSSARALPLAVRDPRPIARRPGRDGRDRGRRGHGHGASQACRSPPSSSIPSPS